MLKKPKINFKSSMVLGVTVGGLIVVAGAVVAAVMLGSHKGHTTIKSASSTPPSTKSKGVTLGTGGKANAPTPASSNTSASSNSSSSTPLSSVNLHIYIPSTKGNFVVVQDQGQTMVIDGGVNSDVPFIKKYLNKLGVTKAKYLVVSNNLYSSIQGLPKILSSVPATYYLSANDVANGINSKSILNWFNKRNLYWQVPNRGTQFSLGTASIQMITTNDGGALLVIVKDGSKTFMFTGSSTVTVAKNVLSLLPSTVDIYSVTQTDKYYNLPKGVLSTINPKAVIYNDTSGANDSSELQQIKSTKATLYSLTGKDGVVITSDGSSVHVNQTQTEGAIG